MIQKNERLKTKFAPIVVITVIFVYMLVINSYMPMMADDYRYAMNWGQTHHLSGIREIVEFQFHHYMEWGGRSIAHSIAQLMLFLGKPVFNVANSVVFITFLLLIYWHATVTFTKKIRLGLLMSVVFFCWFCLPTFGEITVWLLGSCNYLWMTTLILAFLLPYRLDTARQLNIFVKHSGKASLGMFLVGILAGWTNENSGFVLLLAAGGASFYCWKQKRLDKWMLWGLAGAIIGYSLLVAAPGNYHRMLTAEQGEYTFFQNHVIDPLKTMGTLALHQLPIYLLMFALLRKLFIYRRNALQNSTWNAWKTKNAEVLWSSFIYIGLSFIALMMMFVSPTFPQRAGLGAVAFLIIGVLNLLRMSLYQDFILFRKEKVVSMCVLILWLVVAVNALGKYQTIHAENQERLAYIEKCRELKIDSIKVPPFSVHDRSVLGIVVVNDIGENPTVFRSIYYARYFGFEKMSRGY